MYLGFLGSFFFSGPLLISAFYAEEVTLVKPHELFIIIIIIIIPRDAPVGHRRGNNPVEYVFVIFIFLPRSRKKQCLILIEV